MGHKEEHAVTVLNSINLLMAPMKKRIGDVSLLPTVQDKGCYQILHSMIVVTIRGLTKMVNNADMTHAVADNTCPNNPIKCASCVHF